VWTSLVHGFGGMRDSGQYLSFDPRLPNRWSSLAFHVARRESRLRIDLTHDTFSATLLAGPACDLVVAGHAVTVEPDQPVKVPLP
jgi:alpha,alpha-trehalose phosphorylase